MSTVDTSRYQGVIPVATFAAWIAAGYTRVILKVGGGDDGRYEDSCFAANLANAHTAGMITEGYWFNGTTDPGADASFVHSIVPAGMRVWADAENEGSMRHWSDDQADAFESTLEQLGHPSGTYMSASVTFESWPKCKRRPLWVAGYGFTSTPAVGNWSGPVLWQYTSSGHLPGFAGNLDLDVELAGLASSTTEPLVGDEFDMATLEQLEQIVDDKNAPAFLPFCIQNREPNAAPTPGLAIYSNGWVEPISAMQWDAFGMAGAKLRLTTVSGHFAFFIDQAARLRATYNVTQSVTIDKGALDEVAAKVAAAFPALTAEQIADAVAAAFSAKLAPVASK